jgi:hypothetical protein
MSDPEGVEEREGNRLLQTFYPYGIILEKQSIAASTTDTDKKHVSFFNTLGTLFIH